MYADVLTSEVEVIAKTGVVKAQSLVEAVNATRDSEHSFRAKLKRGPEPVD